MAALSEELKTFIVQELACYRSPSQVEDRVAVEFGVVVTRQQVRTYNPEQAKVAKKWREIFAATRAGFLKGAAEVGIMQKAFRARELQELYDLTRGVGQYGEARRILDQAAKEAHGTYSRRSLVDLYAEAFDLCALPPEFTQRLVEGESPTTVFRELIRRASLVVGKSADPDPTRLALPPAGADGAGWALR